MASALRPGTGDFKTGESLQINVTMQKYSIKGVQNSPRSRSDASYKPRNIKVNQVFGAFRGISRKLLIEFESSEVSRKLLIEFEIF